jgi:SAM-dependent methyltransferase
LEKNLKNKLIKLDNWVESIIVDPLSKEPLAANEDNYLTSSYGRKYPVINGIYDLRLLNNETTQDQKVWNEGQREYKRWSKNIASQDRKQDYFKEIEDVREVYEEIPIEGRCLDVGGHHGKLRHFLLSGQEYITCDPFLGGFDDIEKQPNLIDAYPFLIEPVNFICCDAEFLPFSSSSFHTVHMRSVIDHFLSPELALNEAYRVLEADGVLIVGLLVHGGKKGKPDIKSLSKEFIRAILVAAGLNRFKDYHVWHPSFKELTDLITVCGFKIEKVHWQKCWNDRVCYIRAKKLLGLTRQILAPRKV